MDHRLLTSLQARLRFAAANPQPLPLLAGLLVLSAIGMQLFILPGMERADEADQAEITRIERNTRRMNIAREEAIASPVVTRERVLGHFPLENELNAQLGRLLDLANKEGLQIPSGDYRLVKGKEDALFDRYVLNLPAKGAYGKIQGYLAAVRREFPGLAIEDASLRRDSISSAEVEAQLRFVLFCRRDGGTSNGTNAGTTAEKTQ